MHGGHPTGINIIFKNTQQSEHKEELGKLGGESKMTGGVNFKQYQFEKNNLRFLEVLEVL